MEAETEMETDVSNKVDASYKFTMSTQDQRIFVGIDKSTKYGELLMSIRGQIEDKKGKSVDFNEQSSSKFILSKIEQKLVMNTIEAFPIQLPLNDRTLYEYPESQATFNPAPDRIYDVRFVMPLVYHSVSPSLYVDCRDFIAKRCLALTIKGLSSEDHQMRALCYKILERYYEHLLSNLMIDKQLWINLLDLIRNSIPNPNFRLKHIFTTFIVKVIDILLHPHDDKMYEMIKEFLAGRPRLRIDTIEIYDDLLLCSDVDHYNNNLRWLITLFRDGTRTKDDLEVLKKLKVIPQVMCLYNSELRFQRANETICTLFKRITTIETGSAMLVNEFSFLPWLHQTILFHINQDAKDLKGDVKSETLAKITAELTSLICNLVDTLVRKKAHQKIALPRHLEMFNVYIALHDLIIKSKEAANLQYYLGYIVHVARGITSDPRISNGLSIHLLELMKSKMHYLYT